ncbi:MAG: BACON domain-containing protein [Bacteroidales bacterium]|nr:BACON domain-containing protein [Bacteroidales bacterium]
MKIKQLLVIFICAAAFALTGCDPEVPFLESDLLVTRQADEDSLKFDVKGETKRITVQSTRAWTITGIPEWASFDIEGGEASLLPVQVNITVPENTGFTRRAEIIIDAGISKTHMIMYQNGPDGDDDEVINISCADFAKLKDNDGNTYRLKGTISGSINTQYGNFDVVDETGTVYVYGCVNVSQWTSMLKKGNIISITGTKDTFNGKVEMKNGLIENIEAGGIIPPETIIDISIADFLKLPDDDGNNYRIKGTITGAINTQYGNFDVTDGTSTVYVYGCTNVAEWVDKLKKGNSISIYGPKTTYTDKSGNTKIEMKDGTIESITEGSTPPTPSTIIDISIAGFLQLPDDDGNNYRISGTISGAINTQYGNFDVTDGTSTVYVYGCTNVADWKDQLKAGNSITIYGPKTTYTDKNGNSKIEMVDGTIEKIEGGSTPTTIIDISIADFLKLPDNDGNNYRIKGTVGGNINTQYGNFDVTDATGTVYVYGCSNIDQWKSKLVNGATISIYGPKTTYTNSSTGESKIEMQNGTIESLEGGDTPTPGGDITATHPFTSTLTWTVGTSGYDAEVVISGASYSAFKLGTSSKVGTASVKVPAGTAKIGFYALGWSNKAGVIEITGGGLDKKTITAATNAGVNNNSPFTITKLADSDYYTIEFSAALATEATLTFTSTSAGYRSVVFGLNKVD